MKQNYLRMTLLSLVMGIGAMLYAFDYPNYPTQTPTEGGKYVLCNLAVPTGYMSRTSWDGAYYFLGKDDSKYDTFAFTAHQDETGRWFFVTSEKEVQYDDEVTEIEYTYVAIPSGTDNLRGGLNDILEPGYFALLPGIQKGFYYIEALEGNNPWCQNKYLHLNAGGQYFVVNEPVDGGQWYPDFYGGIKYEEDGVTPIEYEDEETGQILNVMADSTSMNWAFVAVEDVPQFVMLGNAYALVNSYEKNYCSIEDYADGFKATLEASMALYKSADFNEETLAQLKAQLNAKVDLYNQILKAEELDAEKLAKAITEAKTAFKNLTATDEVVAAFEKLKKACDDYSMGLGDITSMGQNMSFEDLSSQNGNQTSGCMPAPKGWNVYVNGNKLEEGSTAGLGNWHGINDDCTGYKDGNYGFGIWMPTIPKYEISQTITGLDNGTYTITAGLMVDRRRTTQRIFGNLNSTLFSYEENYEDGILPTEYKTYAGLTEVNDDRTLQEITVRAYVYDGTLTFGVKTDNNIAAALRTSGEQGDGWFKVDNFTISKDGYIESDAQALYDYLSDALEDMANEPMDATYRDKCVVSYTDLNEGITAFAQLMPEIEAQIAAYKPLGEALALALDRMALCEETGYMGVDDYSTVIDDVTVKYEDGEYTAEEIADALALLEEAYQTCLRSGVDEGADLSDLIRNRSFEDLSNQGGNNSDGVVNPPFGWDLYVNGVKCETADDVRAQGVTAWCAINSGDNINVEENGVVYNHQYTDGTHVWGIWNPIIPQVELSQTITGLKPGTYTLTADVMARNTDWSGDNLTTQRLFAQNAICLYGTENDYIPEYLQGTTSNDVYEAYMKMQEGIQLDEENGYEYLSYADWDANSNDILLRTLVVHFGVGEDGTATIGFRTDNLDGWTGEPQEEQAAGWFKLDNFTLYFESSQIPTSIKGVDGKKLQRKAIYDLSGRPVEKMTKGIYIQNGKKVIR